MPDTRQSSQKNRPVPAAQDTQPRLDPTQIPEYIDDDVAEGKRDEVDKALSHTQLNPKRSSP